VRRAVTTKRSDEIFKSHKIGALQVPRPPESRGCKGQSRETRKKRRWLAVKNPTPGFEAIGRMLLMLLNRETVINSRSDDTSAVPSCFGSYFANVSDSESCCGLANTCR
jgi:hypothetical protein